MHVVGLDLAWGHKNPTGVAVLDASGHLVHVGSVRSDAEVLEAVRPFAEGPCVVAFDAPLVVTNDAGNRPCERDLNRDFARFDAGAHPSNLSRTGFAPVPRGRLLADELGLELDPAATHGRRAIEVYPHAATVALFRLGRTLKYKNKQGRSLEQMRTALERLVELLEGLATATPAMVLDHPAWHDVVERVRAAGRKSELRLAEDQVDAVVCAYVGLLAAERPDALTVYGDSATGAIVTPTLPPDLRPTPRAEVVAPAEPGPVHHAVQTYATQWPALAELTDDVVGLVTRMLDDAGINYLSVDGRAKSVASFATKANRVAGGRAVFRDPLREVTDQVGLRVITYTHGDVAVVAGLLGDQLTVLDDRDMGRETADEGRWGYASRHLLVELHAGAGPVRHPELARGRPVQVQLRTVLQHAWAEFEHDVRYKGTVPDDQVPDLDRRFTLAAGLLELADREFSAIRDRLRGGEPAVTGEDASPAAPGDPRLSTQELATFLAGRFSDAEWSRTDHYAWISGLLLELGVTSLAELGGLLGSVDSGEINVRLEYRYPPGAVRRLDDALLAVFGEQYLQLHGNAHRVALLRSRLERLSTPPRPE